jgi:hypothetical protein
MKPDQFFPLLSGVRFEKRIYMDVKAVATYGELRFMLNDFTHGGEPKYFLNVAKLENPDDLVGLNVGHPIAIDPTVVASADQRAGELALDENASQLMVIAHVLTTDSVEDKMRAKPGGLPDEMREFFSRLRSMDERTQLSDALGGTDVKANRRSRL